MVFPLKHVITCGHSSHVLVHTGDGEREAPNIKKTTLIHPTSVLKSKATLACNGTETQWDTQISLSDHMHEGK